MFCKRIMGVFKCDEINICLKARARKNYFIVLIKVFLCRYKWEVLTLDSSGIALNEEALCGEVTN